MRIKQLELNGFKSFRDGTVLELPAGVTAIVGPNGCGKSNVVDAMRWVLGEQSPKHLRGSAMEDVIFNGNAEHGPLGMAEVSMLLERDEEDFVRATTDDEGLEEAASDGLPPELKRAAEVLVTRRYFRSGESEYFINRVPCRLRDITELFLGTGVGTKAYAIIEQGRVEQLVNAKPEEMRLFIEEAAGTTRFRSRKLSAERKMDRTRDNLVRVQDVLSELERQMSSLERQAKRAEEYHHIKGELRDLDLRVMAGREHSLRTQLAALTERVDALREAEAACEVVIERAMAGGGAARAARGALEVRERALDLDLATARELTAQADAQAQSWSARRVEREARVDAARREQAELAVREAALREEALRLAAEIEAAAAVLTVEEARRQEVDTRLAAMLRDGAEYEGAVEAAKTAVADAASDQARFHNLVEALARRREELEGRRHRLDEEQRLLGERFERNGRERDAARDQVVALGATHQQAATERARVAAQEREGVLAEGVAAEHVLTVRESVALLRSRLDSLRELEARREGCTQGAASLLGRGDEGWGLVADVLRVPAHLERAVAAALGARLGHVVVGDTQCARDAVTWLVGEHAGSATVIPRAPERRAAVVVPPGRRLVDEIAVEGDNWALAEALLGGVLLADDLDQALDVWRHAAQAVTVVTPSGEAVDPLGAIRGGSEAPFEESLLARGRELRDLDAQLAIGEATLAESVAALEMARMQLAGCVAEGRRLTDELQSLRLAQLTAEKDLERLDEERGRIAAELEVGALEASGLAGVDGEVATELAELVGRQARVDALLAELRERLSLRQAELAAWRERVGATEEERTSATIAVVTSRERQRALTQAGERQQAVVIEVGERLAQARVDAERAAADAVAAGAEAEVAATTREGAAARAQGVTDERDAVRAELDSLDATLTADDEQERQARERLDGIRTERVGLEVQAAERRVGLEHLAEQLAERYELELAALMDVPTGDDRPHEELAAHVERLRTRLHRLGDVNPAAADELREVRERFEFLAAQRDDLERSLEDLRQTISRLTRTSRQRFEETFTAVNRTLEGVFPRLFPGGTATLVLTDPEEGGEPGIEIVVQPAGKKLQTLSLLSGGEKALTATALVFSLFLIRPTPFCLLDEVDAPLDEANIGRFNQIVREMAVRTQFVLITHNRRTMEVADTLYGITMEQAGVSKVVSVRMREAA